VDQNIISPNHNSGPLKKMCVVCIELEHSRHTTHKDTRYTDEEVEIQRKLPRYCHTKKLGGKECHQYKNKMNSQQPRVGLSIFEISIFQLAIMQSLSFHDFYNSICIFSVD